MECPKCGAELQVSLRHEIRMEHCPVCQGNWFDEGELERLLKRMSVIERRHVAPSSDAEGYLAL
jgi:Zn-finger nucleic acid-binding protein